MLKNVKRNFFIGIRTPWTLANDDVWNKTNLKAGKLFKISAAIALVGIAAPSLAFALIIFPLVISAVAMLIYSYAMHKKVKKT